MRRVLGFGDLMLIAAASIGPAFSLATTFGPMVAVGGSATPLALVAVTAIMVFVAFAYRRLGMRYPSAGSSYSWVRTAFGPEAGAYAAWVLIVANIFATVATAVPAGSYTLALLAPAYANAPAAFGLTGAFWVLVAGTLLYRGLRPTSRVANSFAIGELIVLLVSAAFAFAHAPVARAAVLAPPPGFAAIVGAVAIGIWMIDGWEVSASAAEEARDGDHTPGTGGLVGLILTAIVLFCCMSAFLRVGSLDGFTANEADALSFVGAAIGGGAWRIIITVTVIASIAASLQTTLIYLTRSLFAMGRDGVLPRRFGELDARAQPAFSVIVLTAIGIAGTLASALFPTVKAAFTFILGGTAIFLGVLFLMSSAAAVWIFSRSRTSWFDGVVLPGIAVIALAGVLGVAVSGDDRPTQAFLLALAVAGVPLAVWRGAVARRRASAAQL